MVRNPSYQPDSVIVSSSSSYLLLYLIPMEVRMKEVLVRSPLQYSLLNSIPASVSLLQKSDLQMGGSISYLEKLNQLPGVYAHVGSLNTSRITIRGIGSRTPYGTNRVKAYYDEITLSSADGTTNIEDIDNELIHSVDVLKGPKSAVYGAGLGGIIILEDKNFFPEGIHGQVAFETGEFGTYKPMVNLHFRKRKILVSSFYSRTKSEGFRMNSSYDRHTAQLKLAHRSRKSNTALILHYIDLKSFIPSSISETDFMKNPKIAAGNWQAVKGFEEYRKFIAGIRNTVHFNAKWSARTIVYTNISDGYESRPFNILDDYNQRIGVKSFLDYSPNNWQFRLGFEMVDEKYNWDIFETIEGNQGQLQNKYSEKRTSAALFADVKWKSAKGFIIESGFSYNYQNYLLDDLLPGANDNSGKYHYNNIPAPFAGINVPIGKALRLYSSYSYGFSYPTVEETLLPDGQINNNLKPENGNSFELGFRWSAFDNNLFVDVGTYLLLVDNLLLTERITEDIFTGKNAGSTRHAGLEISSVVLLNKNEKNYLPSVKLNVALTVSENTFTNFVDDGVDYKGKTLPGVPNTNINTSIEFNYSKGLYFSFNNQYTGKQLIDDSNSASYNAYHLVHLKAGYKWKLKKNNVFSFYLGVNNLLDEKYASMILVNAPSFGGAAPRYYYPGQPRYLFGGVGVRF